MTIREVARHAGVSLQTVSNVLNGRVSQMGPKTRERVERAIADLGYQPNAQARGLRSQRTDTVAYLTVDPATHFLADPFHTALISGMGDSLRDHDHCLLVQALELDFPGAAFKRLFAQRRFDGAVVHLSGTSQERSRWLGELGATGAPFVVIEEQVDMERAASVRAGNRGGAEKAVEYLHEKGHTRIGFLLAGRDWPAFDERLGGYQAALRRLRLGPALKWSAPEESVDAARSRMHAVLQRETGRVAVLAANDILALGALQAAKALGRRIPDDVAIVGFDDFDFARYVEPALTTVALPGYEMGKHAAEMLVEYGKTGAFAEHEVIFPTTLVPRQSA
jgi:DNA-binding LacI/PurR family transcriptional regulator